MRIKTSKSLVTQHSVNAFGQTTVDYSNGCLAPITIELQGKPDAILVKLKLETETTRYIDLLVRCRQCERCLKARASLWSGRARTEIQQSARTWFGTLTVRPHDRFLVQLDARIRLGKSGIDFDTLSRDDQFKELTKSLSPEVTKFFKRVRKQSRQSLRYLIVAEKHKDGFPHYHLLIHEVAGTVRKQLLEAQWKFGFSNWRLVDAGSRAPYYVSKYLAKEALTRVRASQRYGQADVGLVTKRLEEALRLLDEVVQQRNITPSH